MRVSIVNLVVDDSSSMGRLGIQSARQAAMQLLHYVEARDRETGVAACCSVWTFASDPIEVGTGLPARELLVIPLVGHGPTMLHRALREVADATTAAIDRARWHAKVRREFKATVSTVLIGDLQGNQPWGEEARRLTDLGSLGLVLVDHGEPCVLPTPIALAEFQVVVPASQLSMEHMRTLINLS